MITNLCFEGGGVKGCAYALVPKALEEVGVLKNIEKVAGSSAGAIAALTIALKYNPDEIDKIITNLDFKEFMPNNSYLSCLRLVLKEGICSGTALSEWIKSTIEEKTGNANITFKDMFILTGIELVVTGTDLYREKTEYFSYKTYPEMAVWQAVRISCSMPTVYDPVYCMNKQFVDGGVYMNYPVHVFDDPNSYEKNDEIESSVNTLGFRLIEQNCKINNNDEIYGGWWIFPVISIIYQLLMSSLNVISKHIVAKTSKRTVPIDVGEISSTDFNISKDTVEILKKNGYDKTLSIAKTLNVPEPILKSKRKSSFADVQFN